MVFDGLDDGFLHGGNGGDVWHAFLIEEQLIDVDGVNIECSAKYDGVDVFYKAHDGDRLLQLWRGVHGEILLSHCNFLLSRVKNTRENNVLMNKRDF